MHRFCLLAMSLLVLLAAAPAAQAANHAKPQREAQFFLSLGDSYAVGFQNDVNEPTTNGPAKGSRKIKCLIWRGVGAGGELIGHGRRERGAGAVRASGCPSG